MVIHSFKLNNPEYPHFGSDQERQFATEYFNTLLQGKANGTNIFFLSIYWHLMKKNRRISHFFFDGVHLSQSAMYLTCNELNRIGNGTFINNIYSVRVNSLKIIFKYYCDAFYIEMKEGFIKLFKMVLKVRSVKIL